MQCRCSIEVVKRCQDSGVGKTQRDGSAEDQRCSWKERDTQQQDKDDKRKRKKKKKKKKKKKNTTTRWCSEVIRA